MRKLGNRHESARISAGDRNDFPAHSLIPYTSLDLLPDEYHQALRYT